MSFTLKYMNNGTLMEEKFPSIEKMLPSMARTHDAKLPYNIYDNNGKKVFGWNYEYKDKHKPTTYTLKVQNEEGLVSTTTWTDLSKLSAQILGLKNKPWFVTMNDEKKIWRSGNCEQFKNVPKAAKIEAPAKPAPVAPAQPAAKPVKTTTIEEDFKSIEAYLASLGPIPEVFPEAAPAEKVKPQEKPVVKEEPVVEVKQEVAEVPAEPEHEIAEEPVESKQEDIEEPIELAQEEEEPIEDVVAQTESIAEEILGEEAPKPVVHCISETMSVTISKPKWRVVSAG